MVVAIGPGDRGAGSPSSVIEHALVIRNIEMAKDDCQRERYDDVQQGAEEDSCTPLLDGFVMATMSGLTIPSPRKRACS